MFRKKNTIQKSEQNTALESGRTQTVVLSLLFALCFGVGLSFHVFEWSTQTPAPPFLSLLYQAVLMIGYGSLALVLNQIFRTRRASPARSMWSVLVAGVVTLTIGAVTSRIGSVFVGGGSPEVPGFDLETGVPLALASIFKMNILSLVFTVFAFVILLKLQGLVLVKRSKASQRNWYLMLSAMVVASLLVMANVPGEPLTEIQTIAVIVVVVFMVVNAFRLSWIVYLSLQEKFVLIGLFFLLGILLFLGFGVMNIGPVSQLFIPGAYAYTENYSYPLSLFTTQAVFFGILYCTSSFLSLLFHLPTSSEFKQRAGERAAMHSLTHLVGDVLNSDNLYSTITAGLVEAGSATASWLAIADFTTGSLSPKLVASHGMDLKRIRKLVDVDTLYSDVVRLREPVLLEQAPADHRVYAKPGEGIGSLFITPLLARDNVLGALFIAKNVVHGFERDDLQTIGIYAAQAAVFMDNALLFAQQVEKERLSRELSIAREVQQKLLPQNTPKLNGLSIAASSVSAHEVGGDYYDFVQLDNNRLAVIIGDVSGKGTSAAFYMAEMQGIFQSLSRLAPSPRDFLSHANTALAHCLDRNVFISVIYGVLDLDKEQFVIARAGHCPIAIIDQAGNARYLRTQGMGLGLDRTSLFKSSLVDEVINLQPGDVFALYTDGVVESRSPSGEEYGYDRLLQVLSANRHGDSTEIHRAVLHDLNAFLQDREYDDDMTLVIIKWLGLDVPKIDTLLSTEIESTLP